MGSAPNGPFLPRLGGRRGGPGFFVPSHFGGLLPHQNPLVHRNPGLSHPAVVLQQQNATLPRIRRPSDPTPSPAAVSVDARANAEKPAGGAANRHAAPARRAPTPAAAFAPPPL